MADLLYAEVLSYQHSEEKLTADHIYGKIEAALADEPKASYESIIAWIANDIGIYPWEIENYYKRCRRVYDKIIRDRKRGEELRKKFEKLMKPERN